MSKHRNKNASVRPSDVNGTLTLRTEFYKDELFKIVKGLFKVTIPDNWERDYLLNMLCNRGYVIISDTSAGVLPLKGALHGYNYLQYPIRATIDVPILGTFEREIGKDCELLYLERTRKRTFYTFYNLVSIYASKLASADAAIDVNLFNSRVAYVAEAESKGQAETIKAIYDKVSEGEPMIVYRQDALNKDGMQVFFGNVKQNYIADMVQDSKRTIMNEFLTLIGINNANTDKRERLVTDEVAANNVELVANIALWKENLKRQTDRINKIFPTLQFNIELQFDQSKIDKQVRQSNIQGDDADDS